MPSLRTLATACVLALSLPALASAQATDSSARVSRGAVEDSALEARTTAIASRLRCPVCQGESIQDSPAELAQEMRGVVRDQLRAGKTPDEIKAYFVARYGEWILLEPKMTGLNILLYAFPVMLIVAGLAFVYVLVRRWTSGEPSGPTPGESA